jgi:phage shock protein A
VNTHRHHQFLPARFAATNWERRSAAAPARRTIGPVAKLLIRWRARLSRQRSGCDDAGELRLLVVQAIRDAQEHRNAVVRHSAAVISAHKQNEYRLTRARDDLERLRSAARRALAAAEAARAAGDNEVASQHQRSAAAFATQLVAATRHVRELEASRLEADRSATNARTAQEVAAFLFESQLADASRLLAQLEQARRQAQLNHALEHLGVAVERLAPCLDQLRVTAMSPTPGRLPPLS